MATPVQGQDSAWPGRSGVRVRAGQNSSTTRADFEQDRVSSGRIRTGPGPGGEQGHAKQRRLGLTVPHPRRTFPNLITRVGIVGGPAVTSDAVFNGVNSDFRSLGLVNNIEQCFRNIIALFKNRLWQSLQA